MLSRGTSFASLVEQAISTDFLPEAKHPPCWTSPRNPNHSQEFDVRRISFDAPFAEAAAVLAATSKPVSVITRYVQSPHCPIMTAVFGFQTAESPKKYILCMYDHDASKHAEMRAVVETLFSKVLRMVDVSHARAGAKNAFNMTLPEQRLDSLGGPKVRNPLESLVAKRGFRLCPATRSALFTAGVEFDECAVFHAAWELDVLANAQ